MATHQQLAAARSAVQALLQQLLAMPVSEWAERQNLGDINFKPALPAVERTLNLFRMLDGISLDFVSINRLQQLQQVLTEVINALKQIEAFTLDISNPRTQRDSIVSTIESSYSNWFELVFPVIAFAIRSSTDFAALERDLRGKIAQAEVTSKELLGQQQTAATRAQETLQAIQKAAAEAGVSREATHFAKGMCAFANQGLSDES